MRAPPSSAARSMPGSIWDPFLAAVEKQSGARILADGRGVVEQLRLLPGRARLCREVPAGDAGAVRGHGGAGPVAQGQPQAGGGASSRRCRAWTRGGRAAACSATSSASKPLTPAVAAEQQKIADTFLELKPDPEADPHRRCAARRGADRAGQVKEPPMNDVASTHAPHGAELCWRSPPPAWWGAGAAPGRRRRPALPQLRIGFQKGSLQPGAAEEPGPAGKAPAGQQDQLGRVPRRAAAAGGAGRRQRRLRRHRRFAAGVRAGRGQGPVLRRRRAAQARQLGDPGQARLAA